MDEDVVGTTTGGTKVDVVVKTADVEALMLVVTGGVAVDTLAGVVVLTGSVEAAVAIVLLA